MEWKEVKEWCLWEASLGINVTPSTLHAITETLFPLAARGRHHPRCGVAQPSGVLQQGLARQRGAEQCPSPDAAFTPHITKRDGERERGSGGNTHHLHQTVPKKNSCLCLTGLSPGRYSLHRFDFLNTIEMRSASLICFSFCEMRGQKGGE